MRLLDIVLSHRTEAAKYHDHKEKTAYGAAALYLAATAAWALNTEFWKDQSKALLGFSAAFLLIAAFLVWKFVGWQFRNREDAARIERACVNVMARIAAGELNADQDVAFESWEKTLLMPRPIVAEGNRMRDALHDEIATHALVYAGRDSAPDACGTRTDRAGDDLWVMTMPRGNRRGSPHRN